MCLEMYGLEKDWEDEKQQDWITGEGTFVRCGEQSIVEITNKNNTQCWVGGMMGVMGRNKLCVPNYVYSRELRNCYHSVFLPLVLNMFYSWVLRKKETFTFNTLIGAVLFSATTVFS